MIAEKARPLHETLTLRQARKLGVGKSEMVYQAAAETGLPCRSLLGTLLRRGTISGRAARHLFEQGCHTC